MLKGLNPLLNPELLKVLAEMGHGDAITIADANFPGAAVARATVSGQVLRVDCDALTALQAVLSVFPLDTFEDEPVTTMQVVGDASAVPPIVAEAAPILAAEGFASKSVERFAFYELAKKSYAVLMTTEGRPYGNFILRKGVIFAGG
jgi:L-fucose mutarotase